MFSLSGNPIGNCTGCQASAYPWCKPSQRLSFGWELGRLLQRRQRWPIGFGTKYNEQQIGAAAKRDEGNHGRSGLIMQKAEFLSSLASPFGSQRTRTKTLFHAAVMGRGWGRCLEGRQRFAVKGERSVSGGTSRRGQRDGPTRRMKRMGRTRQPGWAES